MYDVLHFRDFHSPDKGYVTVATGIACLADAVNVRQVSGDIVVFQHTTNIVPDEAWLWDWEKQPTGESFGFGKSYAMRAVEFARRS